MVVQEGGVRPTVQPFALPERGGSTGASFFWGDKQTSEAKEQASRSAFSLVYFVFWKRALGHWQQNINIDNINASSIGGEGCCSAVKTPVEGVGGFGEDAE